MNAQPVIAIFDIGRTNKKKLLFNDQYQVLEEQSVQLPETTDDDGFPAEVALHVRGVQTAILSAAKNPPGPSPCSFNVIFLCTQNDT